MIKICASVLAADYLRLYEEIKRIEKAGVDSIHIDVMDGHFVEDITFGAKFIKAIRSSTKLELLIHLMVERPEKHVNELIDMGVDTIIVHIESTKNLYHTIKNIKKNGKKVAIAVDSITSLSSLDWVLGIVDMILLTSVSIGIGGEEYIEFITSKIKELKKIIDKDGYKIGIAVDGGINLNNVYNITKAGADTLIIGTTLFSSVNYLETVNAFRSKAYKD